MGGLRFCLNGEFRDECAGVFANPVGNVQTKIKYRSIYFFVSSFRLNMS